MLPAGVTPKAPLGAPLALDSAPAKALGLPTPGRAVWDALLTAPQKPRINTE